MKDDAYIEAMELEQAMGAARYNNDNWRYHGTHTGRWSSKSSFDRAMLDQMKGYAMVMDLDGGKGLHASFIAYDEAAPSRLTRRQRLLLLTRG